MWKKKEGWVSLSHIVYTPARPDPLKSIPAIVNQRSAGVSAGSTQDDVEHENERISVPHGATWLGFQRPIAAGWMQLDCTTLALRTAPPPTAPRRLMCSDARPEVELFSSNAIDFHIILSPQLKSIHDRAGDVKTDVAVAVHANHRSRASQAHLKIIPISDVTAPMNVVFSLGLYVCSSFHIDKVSYFVDSRFVGRFT
jgi:hypothetical protein